jgi:hypothetical protein
MCFAHASVEDDGCRGLVCCCDVSGQRRVTGISTDILGIVPELFRSGSPPCHCTLSTCALDTLCGVSI